MATVQEVRAGKCTRGLSSLQVQDVVEGWGGGEHAGQRGALRSQHHLLWLCLRAGRAVDVQVFVCRVGGQPETAETGRVCHVAVGRTLLPHLSTHLSLLVDVSARALGSSSVFFLLILLCLTVPLSDLPLGSSVKPVVMSHDQMAGKETGCVF